MALLRRGLCEVARLQAFHRGLSTLEPIASKRPLNAHVQTWSKGSRLPTAEDPAVIVLQEWWGVNDEIKLQAQLLADQGYVTLIPDLYRGKSSLVVAEAQHLMDGLQWNEAIEDIYACVRHLRKDNLCRTVGIIGFCMGGALSLAAAGTTCDTNDRLNAAISFYGLPGEALTTPEKIVQLGVPIQGHFGQLDAYEGFSDVKSARAFSKSLQAAGRSDDPFFVYPTQGHAFMNQTEWSTRARVEMGLPPKDDLAIALAWSRVNEFLKENLG